MNELNRKNHKIRLTALVLMVVLCGSFILAQSQETDNARTTTQGNSLMEPEEALAGSKSNPASNNKPSALNSGRQQPAVDAKILAEKANAARDSLLRVCVAEKYHFTPKVRTAYLNYAKAKACADLAAMNKAVPRDFLAWINSDPEVEASVCSARANCAEVILMLYSLRLDLGKENFEKYRQLALATAIVYSKNGSEADISNREPLKLVIPPCPLKPVNTKDPSRVPDVNDHIINFLNEHLVDDVPDDRKWAPAASELVYDDKGVAVVDPYDEKVKKATLDAEKKVKRPLTAADVMASKALQEEFNAYMKSKGQNVSIDCGDHIIYPTRHDMIAKADQKPILDAFHLFKSAYEAKGLLPAARDPTPSPAEACAFLIRNNECTTPSAETKKKPPHCPLTAPWPILTILAADDQPLREREDIWIRYHDKGELHTYGEYIGGIAQQFDFQSARRLCPYPFSYGTFQMMLKDGGVCGTMANMAVRTYKSLGIPASTAGQPGHCALIHFAIDDKTGKYDCKGGQFATAGPEGTSVHAGWQFGEGVHDFKKDRKMMIYHQSIAWAMNYGFGAYLDSTIAYQVFMLLPEADRKTSGQVLLESGLVVNPYNFLLVDTAQSNAMPQAQIRFWKAYCTTLAAVNKPGCPTNGLYNQTVRENMFKALVKLQVPADKNTAKEVYAFLKNEKCDYPATMIAYQLALEGLPSVLAHAQADLKMHLESVRTETSCTQMADEIKCASEKITDKKQRSQWLLDRWKDVQGFEDYFGQKGKVTTDATVSALAKLTKQKLRPESELVQPLLSQVASALKASVAGDRDKKSCNQLADKITAVASCLVDAEQKKKWLAGLSTIIAGHETFEPKNARKNAKPVRDPCADAISKLQA